MPSSQDDLTWAFPKMNALESFNKPVKHFGQCPLTKKKKKSLKHILNWDI